MILSKIAFRNAIKNWRKSLAAIISISAGFSSYVLFQGYVTDVEVMNTDNFMKRAMNGHVILENPEIHKSAGRAAPEKYWITKEHQEKINQFLHENPDVETRVRFLTTNGMISNGQNAAIFMGIAYDVAEGTKMRGPVWKWDAMYGRPLYEASNTQSVLLGQGLGNLMNCIPNEKMPRFSQHLGYKPEVRSFTCANDSIQLTATTENGQMNALDLDVVGLIDAGFKDIDEKWIITSIENFQMLLDTDKVQYYSVGLKSPDRLGAFIDDFNQFSAKNSLPYKAQDWRSHPIGEVYRQVQDLLNIFQVFIVTVIVTISGLSVLNTMLKAVKERTREVGTLRSIGFTGQQMNTIFSLEACYLSMMGVGVGALFSVLVTIVINRSEIYYKAGFLSEPVLFKISVDLEAYLICALLLAVLSVVTSFLASRSISKTTVAENLSHV